uniref:Uncharacterized protein n=1 Tax=Setaria viridis TaxID=4556 RepID=A0A4U6UPZ8_SETVI|nr:hypothetical protein SEVIR_5G358650v2 [Setaria viridis]TKW17315.1 hypothetical protein SEVIR_5G358650v2 [Setaria viridis]
MPAARRSSSPMPATRRSRATKKTSGAPAVRLPRALCVCDYRRHRARRPAPQQPERPSKWTTTNTCSKKCLQEAFLQKQQNLRSFLQVLPFCGTAAGYWMKVR